MFTYEPFKAWMKEHGISYYDLEQTPLSHGSVYNIKYDQTISLPIINYLMHLMNTDKITDVLKYYKDDPTDKNYDRSDQLKSVKTTYEKFMKTESGMKPEKKQEWEQKVNTDRNRREKRLMKIEQNIMVSSSQNTRSIQSEALQNNLNWYVRVRGLSLENLAEQLGRSEKTVSNWLNGTSTPHREDIEALAKLLRVTPRDLYQTSGTVIPVVDSPVRNKNGDFAKIVGYTGNPVQTGTRFDPECFGYRIRYEIGDRFHPEDILILEKEEEFFLDGLYLVTGEEETEGTLCRYSQQKQGYVLTFLDQNNLSKPEPGEVEPALDPKCRYYTGEGEDQAEVTVVGRAISVIRKIK